MVERKMGNLARPSLQNQTFLEQIELLVLLNCGKNLEGREDIRLRHGSVEVLIICCLFVKSVLSWLCLINWYEI